VSFAAVPFVVRVPTPRGGVGASFFGCEGAPANPCVSKRIGAMRPSGSTVDVFLGLRRTPSSTCSLSHAHAHVWMVPHLSLDPSWTSWRVRRCPRPRCDPCFPFPSSFLNRSAWTCTRDPKPNHVCPFPPPPLPSPLPSTILPFCLLPFCPSASSLSIDVSPRVNPSI